MAAAARVAAAACASAPNCTGASVSARAPGSMPSAWIASAGRYCLKALRRVLRRCPKAAVTTSPYSGTRAHSGGVSMTCRRTTDELTLGAGRNAPAPTSSRRVGFTQRPVRLGGQARAQRCGQIAIDLNRIELSGRRQQARGQRALTRADLAGGIAPLQSDRGDDARDDGRIMQEMLAKALAGADHGVRVA